MKCLRGMDTYTLPRGLVGGCKVPCIAKHRVSSPRYPTLRSLLGTVLGDVTPIVVFLKEEYSHYLLNALMVWLGQTVAELIDGPRFHAAFHLWTRIRVIHIHRIDRNASETVGTSKASAFQLDTHRVGRRPSGSGSARVDCIWRDPEISQQKPSLEA